MSENESEAGESGSAESTPSREPGEVADEQLPEDLRPDEDNPLARHPGETGDDDDVIGGDHEGEAERAPLTKEDADYGSD